jgi:hypothetical protein
MITLVLAILGWTCQVQLPAVFTSWGTVPYDCQVANGGPATWTVTAGTLPNGLVLDPQTGLLSQPSVGPNAPTGLSITVAKSEVMPLDDKAPEPKWIPESPAVTQGDLVFHTPGHYECPEGWTPQKWEHGAESSGSGPISGILITEERCVSDKPAGSELRGPLMPARWEPCISRQLSLGEKTLGPEPSGGKPQRRAVPGLLKNGTLFGVV